MRLNNRGNWSLIGLLAATAIIAVLAFVYFGSGGGTTTVKKDSQLLDKGSQKKTVVGRAMDTGKSVDCQTHLSQIRSGIQMYETANNANPPTLKDAVSGVSTTYFYCPVSNQPYTYDAAAGKVSCPTHPNF